MLGVSSVLSDEQRDKGGHDKIKVDTLPERNSQNALVGVTSH